VVDVLLLPVLRFDASKVFSISRVLDDAPFWTGLGRGDISCDNGLGFAGEVFTIPPRLETRETLVGGIMGNEVCSFVADSQMKIPKTRGVVNAEQVWGGAEKHWRMVSPAG